MTPISESEKLFNPDVYPRKEDFYDEADESSKHSILGKKFYALAVKCFQRKEAERQKESFEKERQKQKGSFSGNRNFRILTQIKFFILYFPRVFNNERIFVVAQVIALCVTAPFRYLADRYREERTPADYPFTKEEDQKSQMDWAKEKVSSINNFFRFPGNS